MKKNTLRVQSPLAYRQILAGGASSRATGDPRSLRVWTSSSPTRLSGSALVVAGWVGVPPMEGIAAWAALGGIAAWATLSDPMAARWVVA